MDKSVWDVTIYQQTTFNLAEISSIGFVSIECFGIAHMVWKNPINFIKYIIIIIYVVVPNAMELSIDQS